MGELYVMQKMNPIHLRKIIGGLSVLFGLIWLGFTLIPFVGSLFDEKDLIDYLLLLVMVPLMVIPGLLAIIYGTRLYRIMNVQTLKQVVGLFAVIGAFVISSKLSSVFPEILQAEVQSLAFFFIGAAVAIPLYMICIWFVLPHLSAERPKFCSLLERSAIILMALLLWLLLSSIFDEYAPIKEGYTHIHEEPWGILGLLIPVIVAYGAYRLFAKISKINTA